MGGGGLRAVAFQYSLIFPVPRTIQLMYDNGEFQPMLHLFPFINGMLN
jgi:hypothetical protein